MIGQRHSKAALRAGNTRVGPLVALVLGLGWLTACQPRIQIMPYRTTPLTFTGPAPDVVILSMSGRCTQPCVAPRDNYDYLSSRGTLDLLADTFAVQGYAVQAKGYAANAAAEFKSPYIRQPQWGYATLRADLAEIRRNWLKPGGHTRVVLLGHSHGATWLHYFSRVNQDIPIALQIDLDSICFAWASDFRREISKLDWNTWNEPSPLEACATMRVAGRNVQAKDIVWPNVQRHLEVQSKRFPARPTAAGGLPVNYMFELSTNTRLDGTQAGLQVFLSRREDHSAVTYPNSEAMAWVTEQTKQIIQDWKRQDGP